MKCECDSGRNAAGAAAEFLGRDARVQRGRCEQQASTMRKWKDQRRRVLIVNGFDGRRMYACYLQHEGLAVCEAKNPSTALKAIARFRPDVVVTDYVFPGASIDGPAFIRQVRNNSERAQPMIIVVSGFTGPEDARRARAAGADVFLLKPCLPEDLLAHITRSPETRSLMTSSRQGP